MPRRVKVHRTQGQLLVSIALFATATACQPASPPSSVPEPTPALSAAPPASTGVAEPNASAPLSPVETTPPDPRPPAIESPDPFVFLEVADHGDAVVSLPLGARDKRPIVLATHGNYDTPEWQCQVWRDIVADDAFVLCPRGVARGDSPSRMDLRYEYVSNKHLEKEIDAAVDALRAQYPDHVDDGPLLFTGFSQGAIMGASIMVRRPDRYPRAVLIEGGNRAWYAANAKSFAEGGGKRILFACGQWVCNQRSATAIRGLSKQGVKAQVVFSKGQGHTYGGAVATDIASLFDWVVEDDPRWEHRRARKADDVGP